MSCLQRWRPRSPPPLRSPPHLSQRRVPSGRAAAEAGRPRAHPSPHPACVFVWPFTGDATPPTTADTIPTAADAIFDALNHDRWRRRRRLLPDVRLLLFIIVRATPKPAPTSPLPRPGGPPPSPSPSPVPPLLLEAWSWCRQDDFGCV